MVKVHILEGSNNVERFHEAEPVPAGVGVPQGVVQAVGVAVVVIDSHGVKGRKFGTYLVFLVICKV